MTEIPKTVTLTMPDEVHKYADSAWAAIAEWAHADGYHWIADSIEEQMPPAIEEPLAFASVVKVGTGAMFVRVGAVERFPWVSGECSRAWDELDVTEVLRIGVGEAEAASADEWARLDAANADTEAYAKGAQDAISKIHGHLQLLRAEAITSERKNAYDVAIKTVEGLQP